MNKQLITVTPHSLYARFSAKHTITWILILTPGCIGIIFPVTRMREEVTRERKSPARGTTAVDSRARAEPRSPRTKQVLLTISYEERRRGGNVSSLAQVQGHQQQHRGQGERAPIPGLRGIPVLSLPPGCPLQTVSPS